MGPQVWLVRVREGEARGQGAMPGPTGVFWGLVMGFGEAESPPWRANCAELSSQFNKTGKTVFVKHII